MDENGKKGWLKRNWMQAVTVVVVLVLALRQNIQIEDLQRQLGNRISDLERSVHTSVSNISNQVTYGIEEANQPLETYDLQPTGVDQAEKALLADMSVTLRRWSEDTRAALVMTLGEEIWEIPLTAAGNGNFSAPLVFPLEDGPRELTMAVTVEEDGLFTRQDLGGWGDVSMLLPYQADGWGGPAWEAYENGLLTLSADIMFDIRDMEYGGAPVNDPAFRVYRNGEVVWEQAASLDPNLEQEQYYRYYLGDTAYFTDPEAAPPKPVEIACQTGDEILVVFACTDDYGLRCEFTHSRLTITENGPEDAARPESDDYPRLTWPE